MVSYSGEISHIPAGNSSRGMELREEFDYTEYSSKIILNDKKFLTALEEVKKDFDDGYNHHVNYLKKT